MECDVFADSYGCIITKSIGYQAPFPLVRLGNGWSAEAPESACVHGACFASTVADHAAPRGRLVTLDMSVGASCVSFLQLLAPSRPPLTLEVDVQYVAKVDTTAAASAVVTRGEGGRWSTSLYVTADSTHGAARTSRAHFCRATAASLLCSTLWLAETVRDGTGSYAVHCRPLEVALAGAAVEAMPVRAGAGCPLDIVALTEHTAVAFGSSGVTMADRRRGTCETLLRAAPLNGGVAGDAHLLTFGDDYTLRAYDLRHLSAPLYEATTASYLRIKSRAGARAALLVTSDMVGVFDVTHLTTTASLQHSGDVVLDAAVLPSVGSGVRVCTSTGSGMVYDWVVA
ncbi:hypothetical protein NESM_000565900 [Novymonas esmeraldas]|uniref:Uncharacterized protein n=1 Tax=Novymonas esmeraldas TaxID=1808958 RepID=A0AAW0EQJ3_9TRYP